MTDLGTTNSQIALTFLANSINRQGQVVGDIAVQSGTFPLEWTLTGGFLWQNGTMSDLGGLIVPDHPGLSLSSISAINSRGRIVGAANVTPEQIHAVLLTPVSGATASRAPMIEPLATPQPVRRLLKTRSPEGRTLTTVK